MEWIAGNQAARAGGQEFGSGWKSRKGQKTKVSQPSSGASASDEDWERIETE